MSRIPFVFFLQTEDENFMWTYVTGGQTFMYECMTVKLNTFHGKWSFLLLNEPMWMRRDNITPEIQINCAL